ncbi:MAG: hypothetical protein H0U74_15500 [Bradymonadaceae bacterium]|nr:hypothetical protein [Lujinxingiaceae bacterium]
MSTLKEDHDIRMESAPDSDALEALLGFYAINGYEHAVIAVQEGEDAGSIRLVRGKPGAGWYSSEMTELFTELEVLSDESGVRLSYVVDVKGQRLSDADRGFWRMEARCAEKVVRGEAGAEDLRPAERKRVSSALGSMYMRSIMAAVFFVVIVLLLIFFGIL